MPLRPMMPLPPQTPLRLERLRPGSVVAGRCRLGGPLRRARGGRCALRRSSAGGSRLAASRLGAGSLRSRRLATRLGGGRLLGGCLLGTRLRGARLLRRSSLGSARLLRSLAPRRLPGCGCGARFEQFDGLLERDVVGGEVLRQRGVDLPALDVRPVPALAYVDDIAAGGVRPQLAERSAATLGLLGQQFERLLVRDVEDEQVLGQRGVGALVLDVRTVAPLSGCDPRVLGRPMRSSARLALTS